MAGAFAQALPNRIVPDGRTQTQVQVSGRTTSITTATINGGNAFNSFSQFQLSGGNTANLYVPNGASNLINLVRDGQTVINGTLNAYKNGSIGGNVYFEDPFGFVVGANGVINVGSLTVNTPTQQFLDRVVDAQGHVDNAATAQLLSGAMPLSPDGVIYVRGKINARNGVSLGGQQVAIAGPLPANLLHDAADRHQALFEATVNTDGLQQGGAIVVQNGDIEITAAGDATIAGTVAANGAPGQNAGKVTATAGGNLTIASTAVISAKGEGQNSNGGHIKVYASGDATIADGATLDASAGTSGNGGTIETSAAHTLRLGAAKLLTGAPNGAAGTVLIDPSTVIIGSTTTTNASDNATVGPLEPFQPLPTQGSIDTNGGNVEIDATDSITLEAQGYINTRQTVASGQTPVANDTTDRSLGNSGNITLNAPSMTLDGQLNAFVINVPGTSYTAGTITLTGLGATTIGSGGNLPSFDTNGASLVINATSVGFATGGGYINTRATTFGNLNDTADVSTDNSGGITLNAPTLNLAGGQLNAFVRNAGTTYTAGTIALKGLGTATIGSGGNLPSLDTDGANLEIDASNGITLASGAYINTNGNAVNTSDDTTDVSLSNAGNVTFNAPSLTLNGTINAFAVNATGTNATAYTSGTITLEGLSTATIGNGGNLPNFDTHGASLVIDASSGITFASGAYINTRRTTTGASNDTTGDSSGNSGDITLNAPSLTFGGQLNAFAVNTIGTNATSYSAGTITLTGPADLTLGVGNLPSFDTGGANLVLDATNAIILDALAYINTRQTGSGIGNDTASVSTGNSGNITLNAPNLNLGATTLLNAFAVNTTGVNATAYTAGTITLAGLSTATIGGNLPSFDTRGANLAIDASTAITLDSGAHINTRATGTATADDTADPSTGNSGDVNLTAPTIAVNGPIDAFAINANSTTYTGGTVTLNGTAAGSITVNQANVTLGTAAQNYITSIVSNGGDIAINGTTSITIESDAVVNAQASADGAVASDLSAKAVDNSGNITLTAPTIIFTGGINPEDAPSNAPITGALLLAGANNGFTRGTITLTGPASFTFDATDPVYGAGANLAIDATGSINLAAGGLIDMRGDGYATATLTAPSITFASGINETGGFSFYATPRDGQGVGRIVLAASNGFTLGSTNPIKSLGADIALETGGTIALNTGAVVDATATAGPSGDITLSAATASFPNGINNGGTTPELLAGPNASFAAGTINLDADAFSLTSADPVKTLGANIVFDTSNVGTTLTLGGGSVDSRLSGFNSGNITFTAATIVLNNGINNGGGSTALLAGSNGGFAPGTIALNITNNSFNLDGSGLAIYTLGANLAITASGQLGLTDGANGGGGVIDTRVQTAGSSTANSGNISLTANGIDFSGGINGASTGPTVQVLAGATGTYLPGGISLIDTSTNGGFTFNATDPINTLGASIAFYAAGSGSSIALSNGASIDSRTGTGSSVNSGNITLSAPTVTFATGINGTGTPQLLAQSNGSGAGVINLIATAANGGFTLESSDPINTSGASLELIATGAGSTITVDSNGVINTGTGGLTLSASTVTVSPAASLTDSGVTLQQASFDITSANSVTLPGQNVTLDATGTPIGPGSITIEAGGYIDTRDWSSGFSAGNSGSITLDAPVIVINGTANGGTPTPSGHTLDAGVNNSTGNTFTAGDITLNATLNTTPTYPGGMYTTTTSITLQNGAMLRGKNVSATSSATTEVSFTASAGSTAAGLAVEIAEGLLAGIDVNVLGATSNASVDVQNGSSIAATGDVLLSSVGSETVSFPNIVIQGALLPGTLAILYGADKATVATTVEGTINAGGNLTVAAYNTANVSLESWADSNPLFNSGKVKSGSLYAGGVTVAYGNIATEAAIEANATINAGGQVAVLARNDNAIDVETTALALGNSAVGFAVAVNDFTSNATASDAADLGTGADKVGSVLIEGDNNTIQNVTRASTTTGANALQTVLLQLSAPGGSVGLGVGIGEAAAMGVVVGSGIPQGLSSASNSSSPVKVAATVAYAHESLNATADIAGATGAIAPDVQASGPVAVYARVTDNGVRLDASSSVGSAAPATQNAIATGSKNSFSVALNLGFVDQDANAYIGPGAVVSGSTVGVGSLVYLPIDNAFVCSSNPCSFSEFTSHLNSNLGLSNDLASTYVSASSQSNNFGIAAAVDYVDFTDSSSAWIGDYANVTSTATGASSWTTAADQGSLAALPASWPAPPTTSATVTWGTPVDVTAKTEVQTIDISGNICLSFNCTGGSSAGATTIGGSFALIDDNDSANAGIGANAVVNAAGDLTVASDVDDEAFVISPTSGYGGKNSLAGLVVLTQFDDSSHATISNTAQISAPDVNVDAHQDLTVWSVTGGVTEGAGTGVGISVSVNQIDTSTLAFVGDNSADELNAPPALGLPYVPASPPAVTAGISTNNLSVVAGSSGDVGALSIAAALAISTTPTAGPPSAISSAFSSLTSLLNGNGLGFSFLGGAAGGAGQSVTPPTPPTFGVAISGSASVDQTGIVTEAYLKDAKVKGYNGAANADATTVEAVDDTYVIGGSGSASFVSAGSPTATSSAAIGGALSLLLTNNDTVAFISGSTVDSDAVAVEALAGAAETSVAIGIAGNLSPPTAGGPSIAGSVSVAILKDATDAYVDNSTLSGDSTGTAQVVAYDHTQIGIGGGALAVTPSSGGAYGADVTYVETDDPSQSGDDTGRQVDAEIEGSTVTGYTNVAVLGLDIDQIVAGSLSGSVAPEASDFSGSATIAILNGTTDAGIVNDGANTSSLSTVGSVSVLASGDSDSTRDAPFNTAIASLGTLTSDDVNVVVAGPSGSTAPGASIVSFAGSFQVGKNSVGLSIVYNDIDETRAAAINDSSITTDAGLCSGPCAVNVTAADNDNIQGFAVGVGVATGSFAGAGSAVANVITNTITAQIGNATTADTTIAAPSVGITANDNATIESFAGQIAVAPRGSAAGAAIAYNKIGGTLTAAADKATFTDTDSLTVAATSDGTIETAAIAGAAGNNVAFSGSFTTNFSDNTIDAALDAVQYDDTAGTIAVSATDTADIQSLAGSASYSPSTAIGAGIAVNQIDDSTTAEIAGGSGTSVAAKDVKVTATASGSIQTLAIGIAISGSGVGVGAAGSVATNLNSEDVTAEIDNGADITAENNIGVIANNNQTMGVIAGAANVGFAVIGGGVSLVVNDVTDDTEARITGATTKVDALGTNAADKLTVNDGTLVSVPGLTTLTPTATPPSLAENTTTVSGLAVDATSEQGVVTNAVALGLSADLISAGVSLNIVTDIMGGTTKAYIDSAHVDTRLTADPTVANYVGPQLYINASSQGWTGNLVISAAGGGYAATAAADGVRMERETDASINDAAIGTLYTATTVTSQTTQTTSPGTPNTGTPNTGGNVNNDQAGSTPATTTTTQTAENKTLVPSLGAVTVRASATQDSLNIVTGLAVGFAGSGAGTVIVNVFSANTNAYVVGGTLDAGSLAVTADTSSGFSGNEGSGAGSAASSAVAGAFAVDVGNDTTLAYVGDPTGTNTTIVNVTGALDVGASTENTLNTVVVSVGVAGEAGIAAMADVTVVTNTTTGSLYSVDLNTPATAATPTTTTDASGNQTTVTDYTADGDVNAPSDEVSISANETINITPQAGAGGGGGAAGIGAGANIVVLKSDTTSQIVASNLNVAGNDVLVLAQSTKNVTATTGTAGAGGTAGIGATVSLVLIGTGDTGDVMGQFTGGSSGGGGTEGGVEGISNGGLDNNDPSVGSGNNINSQTSYSVANAISSSANDAVTAQVVGGNITAAAVSVTANSYIGISNFTTAVAVGGTAGIGGSASFTRVYDTVNADTVGGTITTPSITLTADAGDSSGNHTASDTATAGGGGLVGLGAGVADGLVDNEISASLGGTVVAPAGDTSPISITVDASDTSSLYSLSAGGGVGAVAVGVMVANASKSSSVTAEIPNAPSTETLSTASTPGIDLTLDASDSGQVKADAYGVAGGVLGSGAGAGAAASDSAHITAEIGTGNALNIGSGSIGITASDTPDVETQAVGVAVAGGAGLGASIAQSTSSPTVLATVGDNASIGGLGSLAVNATLSVPSGGNSTTAQADIGTGGILLSANAAVATAQSTPHVTASTGTDVHLPDGNVSLTANSVSSQNASSTGVSVGGDYAAGTSLAFAETGCTQPVCSETATTTAELGAGATGSSDRTGALSVNATGTDNEFADTVAGSGAIVAGNATVATTYDSAIVSAQVDGSASATGATDLAVGALTILATHTDNFSGTANSVNAAALGASGSGVSNGAAAVTTASIGAYVTFTVNSDALVSAENNFNDTNGGQSAEGAAGGVANAAAAISEIDLCSSSTPCAANVTLGQNVTITAGTDPVLNPGGIDLVGITLLQGTDDVNLTTGGALAGAGVTSHFFGTFSNTVTVGTDDTLKSQGDLDVGSYDQLFFNTVADVATYGLGVAGVADATTTINPTQTVIIEGGATLTAMGNVNLTAGNDPTGAFDTIVSGSATAVGYVYGLIAIPSANATVNEFSQTAVTVDAGAHVLSAQNVTIGGYPSAAVANVDGEAHYDELGIPFTQHGNHPNVTTPTAVVTINGTVIAGIYHDLDVMIPDCANSGDYCSELFLTDSNFDDLGNALIIATSGMPLTVAAGAPVTVAVFNPEFDPGLLSDALPAGVANSLVGAYAFGPLLASAGDVNLNATSFVGTGTITAYGAPSIIVRNFSPDYLIMSSVLIPDLAGGSINFTGSATHDDAVAAGLSVNPVGQNGTPAIDIENNIGSGLNLEPGTVRTAAGYADTSGNGPALYTLGVVDLPGFLVTPTNTNITGVVNLAGIITIANVLGSYGATEPVLGDTVVMSIPNGFTNIPNVPSFEVIGGNPFSEWADFIRYPGNNPDQNKGFNGDEAAAFLANAAYNATGTYTDAASFTNYLIGNPNPSPATGSTPDQSTVFFGNCFPVFHGDCSSGTAQNFANEFGTGVIGFADTNGQFAQVPIETLSYSSYNAVNCSTIACQYGKANLTGSAASSAVFGNNVQITAAIIDLGGTISGGRATNWTVDLPASLVAQPTVSQRLTGFTVTDSCAFSFCLPVLTPVYTNFYSGGGVIANFADQYNSGQSTTATLDLTPYLAQINPGLNNDKLPTVAIYNAQTNSITVQNINASAAGGELRLNGAIVSTNPLGTIHMNAGLGQVNITNETGLTLDTENIDAGSAAANGTVSSVVDIIDTLKSLQTWYVFSPAGGVIQYTSSNLDPKAAIPTTGGVNVSSGTTYQPLSGERFEWVEQATLARSVNGWNLGNWQFTNQFGASSNLPWLYLTAANAGSVNGNGTGYEVTDPSQLSITPQAWLTNVASLENTVFSEQIGGGGINVGLWGWVSSHGCNGLGSECNYGFYENRNPGPECDYCNPTNSPSAVWYFDYVTSGYLQLTNSVKADNSIGINFSGSTVGTVNITSNGKIDIGGTIGNPDGNTSIASSNGNIVTDSGAGLVSSINLSLSATNGIGASGQSFNITLSPGGVLNAAGGSAGVYVNLNSSALLGTVSAQTGSSYGPVTITATGDLMPASGAALITGSQINLSTTQGAIGSVATPLNIDDVGPVVQNADGSISGAVSAGAENDIVLIQTTGNFNVLSVASTAGNVVLTADAGNILDARGVTGAAALAPAQLHLDGSAAQADSVAPFDNLLASDYQAYKALLNNGTVSGNTFTLNGTLTAGALSLYRSLAIVYLNSLNPATPVTSANITAAQIQQYARHLYATYTGDFATYLGANWASQPEFAQTIPNYAAYWALIGNGTVSGSTFTLSNADIATYTAAAVIDYNQQHPTAPVTAATITNAEVQAYAQTLYTGYIGQFTTDLGVNWQSQAAFQSDLLTVTTAEAAAFTSGSAGWTPAALASFVQDSALQPASTVVGSGTPNVTGRNVKLVSHAGSSVNGDIGALAPSLSIPVSAVTGFTLTPGEQAALQLAIAPGAIVLEDQNGKPIDFSVVQAAVATCATTGTCQFPTGTLPTTFVVSQTAPFFLTASGATMANAAGAIYLQSTGQNLTIANIVAGASINLAADESIIASGAAPQISAGGSLTMAANGSIGASGAPVNYTVGAGDDLLSAVAGGTGNAYLEYDGGDMRIGQVGAGGTASVDATHGGIVADPALGVFDVIGGSVVLSAQTNIGSQTHPLQVETTAATGTLTGTAGTDAYLLGIGTSSFNIATLTAPTGIDITTLSVPLTAQTLTAANGPVTVGGGNSVAIDDLIAGGAVDLTAIDAMTFGAATGTSLLKSGAGITIDAGGTLTVDPHTEIQSSGGLTITADSLAMDTGASMVATGQVSITTTHDATLGAISTAYNGDHAIDVTAGSANGNTIVDLGAIADNGDNVVNIAASQASDKIYLTATDGVGALNQLLTVETPQITVSTIDGDIGIYAKTFPIHATSLRALFGNVTFNGDATLTLDSIIAGKQINSTSANGALILDTTQSGGSQTFQAQDDISFTSLVSTGIAGDRGDIGLTSTGGAVYGAGATPTALTGSVNAYGGIGITSHGGVEIATLISNAGQTLQAGGDIDVGTATTNGLVNDNRFTPDNGNFSAISTVGAVNIPTVTAYGTALIKANGAGGTITVTTVTSGGQQELDAAGAIIFTELQTTGLGADNGNLIVDASAGSVLGTAATPAALTGMLDANGTLKVTTSDAIEVETLTSNGTQTLQAGGDIDYTTVTVNGLAPDNGNFSAVTSGGNINGFSTTVNGTATLKAQGPSGTITVHDVTSGGQQELDATDAITFATLKTTGLGPDNGNLIVDSTAGSVLGTGSTPTALTGTLTANGTLKVTAGDAIEVASLTSHSDQTLQTQNDIDFNTINSGVVDTNGTATEVGNLSATSTAGTINGQTVDVEGTALIQALGPNGTITIDHVTSDGQQELDATNNVEFLKLTTEGLGADNGNVIVNSTNGAILGEGATPASLQGTIDSNGTVSVTAAGPIELATVESNGTQHYLTGGDFDFGSLTTTGMSGDAGDVDGIAVGDINGDTIKANGDVTLLATNIAVNHITAAGATFDAHKTLTLPDIAVKTFLDLGADVMTVTASQIPAVPASATPPLDMDITGFDGAIGTQATLNIDAPAGLDIGKLFVGKVTLITTAEDVNIADADVPHWLWLQTPDPIIYVDNDSPRPVNGVQVQLYAQDGTFSLDQISNTTHTDTHVVYYEPGYSVVGETTFDGHAITRNAPNDATWTIQYPTTFNLQSLLAYFPMIVPAEDGGAAVNLDMDDKDQNQ